MLIEIRDEGVGVSASRLSEMNWRLDHPPGVDVSVSRHMGLFAVSRLAARRGIRVRLRAGAPQGLTALVWLPGTLTSHEQPPTVGMHSRPQAEGVLLPEEMAFAEAIPAEGGLLQRTPGRNGGRHRLGLLAANGDEPLGDRGYATASGGYATASGGYATASGGYATADSGYAAAGSPQASRVTGEATGASSGSSSGRSGSPPRRRPPAPARPGATPSNHRRQETTGGSRLTPSGAPRAG